jgi:hypothetical protein
MRLISFEQVRPAGRPLDRFWHGLGMDAQRRVYVAIGTGEEMHGRPGDVLIFRYDTRLGTKEYLSSVREVLAQEGNLGPNEHWPRDESVAKVHSDIFELDGRMYFSTHDWHVFDSISAHRGGHFIEYDPAADRFTDLSKNLPLGVSVVGEGIIAMNVLEGQKKLVGWTFPFGSVLVHDLGTGRTTRYPGAELDSGWVNVSRVVITTQSGGVFASYERDPRVPESQVLYKLDWANERLEPTGIQLTGSGWFEGRAETADGRTIYLADRRGYLFAFDTEEEKMRDLGPVLPPHRVAAGERVRSLHNLALSPDETKLFTIPRGTRGGTLGYHLLEHDLVTGETTDLGDFGRLLKGSTPTGNGVFDEQGRYYLSYYFGKKNRSGILQVDVRERLGGGQPEAGE